jgi:transcriptional regulator with XRE-family HTH domain
LLIWQTGWVADDLDAVLASVGPRLRALRRQRDTTLAALAAATGISVSTLSRLESGQRRPTLELLLPLAQAHAVPIDELVGAPPTGDPRVHMRAVSRRDMTLIPLSRRSGGVQAYKLIIPCSRSVPELKTHEGYEWLYVLDGQLRLVLGDQDLILQPGEAAEFGTQVPHWFGCGGDRPAEVLSLFGRQGERAHLRARPAALARAGEPD